jgi:Aegerolysin
MKNYQCHITIDNRTKQNLKLSKAELKWGEFGENMSPVPNIPPKTELKAFIATGSEGLAGTEGTVIYEFQDEANLTVSIYFDVPTKPFAKNTVKPSTSHPDVNASLAGLIGKGPVESCTIKVVDGR